MGNDVDGANDRQRLDEPVRDCFYQLPNFVRLLTSNGYLAHQSGKWWEGSHSDGGFTHGMMPRPARHGSPERFFTQAIDSLKTLYGLSGVGIYIFDFISLAVGGVIL